MREKAASLKIEKYIVTLGISKRPETGYGYIQYSDTDIDDAVFFVNSFKENQIIEAEQFIEEGNYL